MSHSAATRDHYQAAIEDRAALLLGIAAAVDRLPKPVDAKSLSALDQFHFGGLQATIALTRRLKLTPRLRVLDAGCGLGGPARFIAEAFHCHVTGVDLAPDYIAVCNLLTERAGLTDRVVARTGDLTALPFEDACFDLVWSQHVSMNVIDRAALYGEVRRVLTPRGQYAVFDPVLADGADDLIFPVPWARTPSLSNVLTRAETEAAWKAAGLVATSWDDVTDEALAWTAQAPAPSGLNLGLVVGSRMPELVGNYLRNLREGRLRLVMATATPL